ncbi:MAG: DUF1697 domain-containing protein, partial [Bacteroidales bacterium]|jgi:uncharacterized protein (DUF1697 family)
METYIAFLRGINVSGQKLINMADLRAHLEELGFSNVQTYIQSGNIVFTCRNPEKRALEQLIEQKISEKYHFEVPVAVLNRDELTALANENPFLKVPEKETDKLYVTILFEEPPGENVDHLYPPDDGPDEFVLMKGRVYLFLPNGYGMTKLNNNFFEHRLKVRASTRNWKTIRKLLDMAYQNQRGMSVTGSSG